MTFTSFVQGTPTSITASWTPTTLQANQTYVITFQATDNFGLTANTSVSITVPANPPPTVTAPSNQNATEGASQLFSLGSFSDSGPGPWTVDVNWGDSSTDTTFSTTPGTIPAQSHTYAEEGSPTVMVTVKDTNDNESTAKTFQVTTADAALTAGALSPPSGTGTPTVSFFANTPSIPEGVAVDASGNVYAANYFSDTVSKVTPAGAVSPFYTLPSGSHPDGLAFDAAGNLYVSSVGTGAITKITFSAPGVLGGSSTFVTCPAASEPQGMAFDSAGNLYVALVNSNVIAKYNSSGGTINTSFATGFSGPRGLAFDQTNNILYVTNTGGTTISKVAESGTAATTGTVSTFATGLSGPYGLAYGSGGNLYVTVGSTILQMTFSAPGVLGATSTYATGLNGPGGLAFDNSGNVYVGNGGNDTISKVSPPPPIEGQAFTNQTVFHFTDADPAGTASDYTATVIAGDATLTSTANPSNVQIVANAGGGFDVKLSYTYAEELTNATFSVSVTDHNATASASTSAFNVADAALTAGQFTPPTATEGIAFTNVPVFHFTDADPAGTAGDYSALVTLGDGNTVTLTSTPGPNGQIVANAGGFDVQLSYTYGEELTGKTFSVVVTDHNATASASTSTFKVTDAALTPTAVTITVTEGTTFTKVVALFSDANTNPDINDFSATITWNDGNVSAGTIAPATGGFSVTGTNNYHEEGTYAIDVAINDVGGSSALVASTAHVGDAALQATASNINFTEGSPYSGPVATFTDANPFATNSDFSGSINWGDGTVANPDITPFSASAVTGSNGNFTVNGGKTYAEEGTYPITVSIMDDGGQSAGAGCSAIVADAALMAGALTPPVAVESQPFTNVPVFHFTDADPNGTASDYSALVTLGDGNTVTLTSAPSANGQIVANSGGGFDVQLSYTYAEELSNQTFSVTVTDNNAMATASNSAFSVADAPLSNIANVAFSATEGVPFSGTVASFTDTDPGTVADPTTDPADYSATIHWGDGSTSPGTISYTGTPGNFTVSGTNTYAEDGVQPSKFYVTISHGTLAPVSTPAIPVIVNDAALTLGTVSASGGVEGVTPTSLSATFTDANPNAPASDFSGSIDWGDGNPATPFTSADVTANGNGNGSFTITASYQYAEESAAGTPYNIAVTINDVGGKTTTDNGTTTVDDAPVSATSVAINAIEGIPFTGIVATFTDANPNAGVGDFSATIVWDASGANSPGVITVDPNGGFDVTDTHTYAEEGTYSTITSNYPLVRISDVGGSSDVGDDGAVTVADAPLTAGALTPPVAVEGAPFSNVTVFQFSDADPTAPITDYTAVVALGDGNTVTLNSGGLVKGPAGANGQIVADGGGFDVQLSYTYAEYLVGQTFSVTVTDAGGASTSASTGSGFVVTLVQSNGQINDLADADIVLTNPSEQAAVYTANPSVINYLGAGGVGESFPTSVQNNPNPQVFPGESSTSQEVDYFAVQATANVFIPAAGDWTFGVSSDDGFSLTVGGLSFSEPNPQAPTDTFATYNFPSAGLYPLNLIYYQQAGGAEVEVFAAPGNYGGFNSSFELVGDPSDGGLAAGFNVADALLTAGALTPPVAPINTNVTVFNFTDANPTPKITDYTALVTLGDGNTVTLTSTPGPNGQIVPDGGGFDVQLTYTYAMDLSNQTFAVLVNDAGGASTSASATFSLELAALSTTAVPGVVTLGSTPTILTDTASLVGGYNPTGMITFTLQAPNGSIVDTEYAPVNHGDGTYSTPTGYTLPSTGTVVGAYTWDASYGGDPSNNAATPPPLAYNLVTLGTFDPNPGTNTTGANPYGGVVEDSSGNLFGTTENGGAYGFGTVFEVTAGSGTITPLASFGDATDGDSISGGYPQAGLIEDKSGNLFGTTTDGGAYGFGTVFEVAAGSGVITPLASFGDATNGDSITGSDPLGSLVEDSHGNLFGTTTQGGANGYGTVFEVTTGSGVITPLASFDGSNTGANPYGTLIEDSNGNLFGTTEDGGANGGGKGYGTVFEVTAASVAAGSGTITPLASFDGSNTGANPQAGLVEDSSGNLFGTTTVGGAYGFGTVFEVTAASVVAGNMMPGNGTITPLASFGDSMDDSITGSDSQAGLVADSHGNLFGTTTAGGADGNGTVFEVAAGSGTISPLASLNNSGPFKHRRNGPSPISGLVEDSSGDLFGTTANGGNGNGTVFELTPPTNPEQVTVSAANPTITTTASAAGLLKGALGTTAPTLTDTAVLANGYYETGSLVFTLTGPAGFTPYTQTVPLTGNGNGTYTASDTLPTTGTVAGTYTWSVSYAADANNNSATDQGGTAEQTVVSAASPGLSTSPSSTSVTLGTTAPTLNDTITLRSGYYETGSITATLVYGGSTVYTDVIPLSGACNASPLVINTLTAGNNYGGYRLPTSGTVTGSYQWNVSYSDDTNNNTASDNNDIGEQVTVYNSSPALSTTPSATSVTLGTTAPTLNDTITLRSGYYETGSITATLVYGGSTVYTDVIPLSGTCNASPLVFNTLTAGNGAGGYTLPTTGTVTGSYQWNVSYSDDTNNNPASDNNDGGEQVTVNNSSPALSTTPSATSVTLGTTAPTLNDTITLRSGYYETGTITATLVYGGSTVYTDVISLSGSANASPLVFNTLTAGNNYGGYTLPTSGTVTGSYQWNVSYSDDTNDNAYSDSSNSNEQVAVNKAPSGVVTISMPFNSVTLGTTPPALVAEITLGGGYYETGSITVTLEYDGATVYTDVITLSGAANASPLNFNTFQDGNNAGFYTLPTSGTVTGTYEWQAIYFGDPNNIMANSPALVTVNKASPTLSTTPSATSVTLGTTAPTLNDTITLRSGYYETGTITATLVYGGSTVYTDVISLSGSANASPLVFNTLTAGNNAGGYTLPTSGTVTGTYQWNVSYGGDPNNNLFSDTNASNEQVTVSKASPGVVTISMPFNSVTLGTTPPALVAEITLGGGYYETGSITVTLEYDGATVYTDVITLSGAANASPLNFNTFQDGNNAGFYTLPTSGTVTGTYQWQAIYSGDPNNIMANSPARVTVNKASPTLSTTPSATSVTLGTTAPTLNDAITLSSGYYETGSITVTLVYGGSTVYTDVISLSSTSNASPLVFNTLTAGNNYGGYTLPTSGTVTGSYQWNVTYSDDTNNNPASDNNDSSEQVTVSAAQPTIMTTASSAATLGNTLTTLSDTAVLANGYYETGSLVFTLTGPAGFTPPSPQSDTVTGTGNGIYSAIYTLPANAVPGTYTWHVAYAGDGNNKSAADQGGAAEQTVVSAIAETLAGDVLILNQTANGSLTDSGNAQLNVAGTLQVDSNSIRAATLSGNADVDASQILIVGGDQVSGSADFNLMPTTHAADVADPLAFLAAPTAGAVLPAINLSGNNMAIIYPGSYSSINVSGNAKLTLSPGTYVIGSGGITVSGTATVTGGTAAAGVLIYNAGAFTVSGNAIVTLTASGTGEYAGLAIFQARSDTNSVTISGNANLNLSGALLYDANTQSFVTISGNATLEASLDVNELTISGNGDVTAL